MPYIDLHCDTLSKLLHLPSENLKDNSCCITISKLQKADAMAQFFACFTYLPEAGNDYDKCYINALSMMDLLHDNIKQFPEMIGFACSVDDMIHNKESGKISTFLTVEEGGILNDKMERIDVIYDKGVRLVTPLWNYENCFGHPNSRLASVMMKGLKPFGREAVECMGEKGMIIDVSHSSDATFQDILACAKGPVVASHSNCRELADHPRNLSDEMIRALAEHGGIAGLNFYGPFLGTEKESRIEGIVRHIIHMIDIGGSEFPAIGTDFDGFDGMIYEDIADCSYMSLLWDALHHAGLSDDLIEKIQYGNASRIISQIKNRMITETQVLHDKIIVSSDA